jgi:plasmid stabilization system protein ParE
MKRAATITAEAERDIEVIIDYLNEISPSYANIFHEELKGFINNIIEAPELFIRVRGKYRRLYMKRFKYHLIFTIDKSIIRVIAVVHESRHAERWVGVGDNDKI